MPPVPTLTTSASALCTRFSVSGFSSMVRISSGPIFTHGGAVDRFHLADESRTIKLAAVGYRRHHVGELQRRHGHITLADGDRHSFAGIPGLAVAFHLPVRVGNRAAPFVVQGDAGFFTETEGARPFGDLVDAELCAELVVISIAGFDQRSM